MHTHIQPRFRIFSRSTGINIYSPVDGAPLHEGILRAKDTRDTVDLCIGVSVPCAALVHIHVIAQTVPLHLFHARWFTMPSAGAMPSNPDRRRLRPLPVKGQNTLSNKEEKRSQYSHCIECTGRLISGCLL